MIKIVCQPFGSQILVGCSGENRKDLNEQFYSFYNWGCVNANEPNWWSENFFTVWTTPLRLERYLDASSEALIYNKYENDGLTPPPEEILQAEAKKLASERKNAIIVERLIEYSTKKTEEKQTDKESVNTNEESNQN